MARKKSFYQSTALVSALTVTSRVLGFLRDMLMASLFGATPGFDAFLVAFKIPNFMRGLFAEGSFSQCFVPVLAHYQNVHTKDETLQFIARTLTWLMVIVTLLAIFFEFMTPYIVLLFAPGFLQDSVRYAMTIHMLHMTLPYVALVSLTALWAAVLNAYGYFGVPAFTPILLNVTLIVAGVFFQSSFKTHEDALALGVLVAGVIQLLFQFPFLFRYRLLKRPHLKVWDEGVWRVIKNLVPSLLGVSVLQLGLMINTLFASFLQVGSVSWLYYAERLAFLPLGIVGVALTTVMLPHLSKFYAKGHHKAFIQTTDWALRWVLLLSLPAAVGLMALSLPISVTLFQHGEFSLKDSLMTQQCLIAFSIGLPAFMLVKIFIAACYARQDMRSPVRIALIATAVNILVNAVLMVPLAQTGLALGTTMSAGINAILLFLLLYWKGVYKPLAGWYEFLVQLLISNTALSMFLYLSASSQDQWLRWHGGQRVVHLVAEVLLAITIYSGSLWLTGFRLKGVSSMLEDKVGMHESH